MGGLSQAQVANFERDGYLVVNDVLAQDTVLQPVRDEYAVLLKRCCERWVSTGHLDNDVNTLNFDDQLLAVYAAGLDYCQPLDISLPPGAIEPDTPFHVGPAIFDLMTCEPLLDCIASLIGSELTSNPIQHVRIKPPQTVVAETEVRSFITSTDWHQDRATALSEADNTQMITAWVAMTDATAENGCLQVIPGSHRDEIKHHCPLPQLGIPSSLLEGVQGLPIPVDSGGVVLFHPLTVHGSLSNQSQGIRWSFDLRFNVTGQPTGRPMFPSFVARSLSQPGSELKDAGVWRKMWLDARAHLAQQQPVQIHRWPADAEICA